MTEQITTIPGQPVSGEWFSLDYLNLNYYLNFNDSYYLKNTSNINVSNQIQNIVSLFKTSAPGYYIVSNGNYFYTSNDNNIIYKIDKYGIVTQINTGLTGIRGMVFDNQNNLYFLTFGTSILHKLDPLGNISNYVSNTGITDGCGLCMDTFGNFYIQSYATGKINKIDQLLNVTTFVTGIGGFDLVIDSNNNIYASNQAGYVKKITHTGVVSTLINVVNAFTMFLFDNYLYVTSNNSFYGPPNPPNQLTVVNINTTSNYIISLPSTPDTLFIENNILFYSSGNDIYKFNISFYFSNVILPAGYNTLNLYNSTTSSIIGQFTIFVQEQNPGTICFKEGTKILCKLNGEDLYIPIENIGEGMLVKTYKNGYKKCKFNMRELLKNTTNHNINNLFRQSKLTNSNLFEDLYITGSHSMLYDNLTEKEEEAMYKLLATYNTRFNIEIPNKIEDKYKLIAYYDKSFTEVKQDINVNIYHLVLESDSNNRNYGIWANGVLTESIDEFTLLRHLNNSDIKLVNVAKRNNKILNNVFLSKSTMNLQIDNKPLGTKLMNKLTKFK